MDAFYIPKSKRWNSPKSGEKIDWAEIEGEWQQRWKRAGVFESKPLKGRKKFFILFAYPGTSGYLHVGHMRGYTLADALARYKRMDGYNVLFPCGTHASGNQAVVFASRVERRDPEWIECLLDNGCPENLIPRLSDPVKVVEFLNAVYVEYWKRFGLSIDFRRFICTTYPDYSMFIQWQFRKLRDMGLLRRGAYYGPACPSCGPVAVDSSETDLSKGGSAEKIEFLLVPFRMPTGEILPAATLRPETISGVTNIWINPDAHYIRAAVGGETWIVSSAALIKLNLQHVGVEEKGDVKAVEIVEVECEVPLKGSMVPVLPSSAVDPDMGTGIVMSVPAHSPMDWIALQELIRKEELTDELRAVVEGIRPITIVDQGPLAICICKEMGLISLKQSADIENATNLVNREELSKGRMNRRTGHLAGLRVAEAREKAKKILDKRHPVSRMYDLSEKVVCRCGRRVLINRIPDQWFINYGNKDVQEASMGQAAIMEIKPRSFAENMANIIGWFRERPCARRGEWLGTPLPFDPKWIIEPISDSTLYPAFYTICHLLKDSKVRPDQMKEELFDFIFLGKGRPKEVSRKTDVDISVLRRAREEFTYWYPVDLNIGGKEHQTVHFPVFLMNHIAILDRVHWPRGFLSHWYIVMGVGKISKSKGGAVPIPNLAERYSVDGMRLYYSNVASPFADVEWDEEIAKEYRSQVERCFRMMVELPDLDLPASDLAPWILSKVQRRIEATRRHLESRDFRKASNEAFFGVMKDLRWYLRRGGGEGETVGRVVDIWVRLVAPFTPHMSEEIWRRLGKEGFVSLASYPNIQKDSISEITEMKEEYLKGILRDIHKVRMTANGKPKEILFYVSTKGKSFDELSHLGSNEDFLSREFGCAVRIFDADDPTSPDPGSRKAKARPLRPAIWITWN